MRQFLIAMALFIGVDAQTSNVTNQTCSLDTPYPVYEFDKVALRFLESIVLLDCDTGAAAEAGNVVEFNCLTRHGHLPNIFDFISI